MVYDLGFGVWGLKLRMEGVVFRVPGFRLIILGLVEFRV
jgi:hypothetical protein